jgi:peptidyl-prolyl cis-trans isomerase A (cyclophilin A)
MRRPAALVLVIGCIKICVAVGQTITPSRGAQDTGSTPRPVRPKAAAAAPTAVIHTTAGDMKCQLFPDKAPKTVANFVGLATGTKDWTNPRTRQPEHQRPLYDGVIFHRVIPGFMVQTGDPLGSGSGEVGFTFEDEIAPGLLFDKPGRLAMANRGPNTNGSQFFVTVVPTPFLNQHYTIFGQCDSASLRVAQKIALGPCSGGRPCDGSNSRPQEPVRIRHIEIRNYRGLARATKP